MIINTYPRGWIIAYFFPQRMGFPCYFPGAGALEYTTLIHAQYWTVIALSKVNILIERSPSTRVSGNFHWKGQGRLEYFRRKSGPYFSLNKILWWSWNYLNMMERHTKEVRAFIYGNSYLFSIHFCYISDRFYCI